MAPSAAAARQVNPLVLFVVVGAQFVLPLSLAGTAVALPSIARDLGSNATQLQLVVNGFNVCFALFTIMWGRLADHIGYRVAFQAGITLALVGSIMSALAPTLLLLDLARVVAGIGAASVLTLAATIISDTFEGPQRARAFTAFGAVSGFGLAAGPFIAGGTVSLLGWRAVFVLHAILLLLALIGSRALPPGVHDRTGQPRQPVFDMNVLRNAPFMRMALVPVAGAIGFVALLTYLPSGFEAIHGWSDGTAGAYMMIMTFPVFIAPLVSHRLIDSGRATPGQLALVALICLIAGPAGLLLTGPEIPAVVAVVPMMLCGLGFGIPLGFVDGEALAHVPADRVGTAAGVFNLLRIGSEALFVAAYGGAISALIATKIADSDLAERVSAGASGHATAYVDSQNITLIVVAILCAFVAVGYLCLTRTISGQPKLSLEIDGK